MFEKSLSSFMVKTRATQISVKEILSMLNLEQGNSKSFTKSEVMYYLKDMQINSKVLVDDGIVYLQ